MSNKVKKILGICFGVFTILLLIAGMVAAWIVFGAKPQTGEKEITIEVINAANESVLYEFNTDAEFLRQAMDEAEGLSYVGEEGPYGLMITIVNDERAVYEENGAYWSFYVNGEYCNYGIDEQPVLDGDAFVIKYAK